MKKSRMRKILFVVATCVALLLTTGCGKNVWISSKAASVGESAIKIADRYLDNDITAEEAGERLDELMDKMDYVNELPTDTHREFERYIADKSVDHHLLDLWIGFMGERLGNDKYDDILEARNELAEEIGVKKRK